MPNRLSSRRRFSTTVPAVASRGAVQHPATFLLLAVSAVVAIVAVGASASAAQSTAAYDESVLLSRIRQLTFEGRRAGEGYYSPDGTHMTLQSERAPGNPFFQIYDLDLTTGDTRRISPGFGKTTCPFFQPGTGAIVFSSTHHDPRSLEYQQQELEFRASGQERRYSWDYDPEMEVYIAPGPAVTAAGPDGEVDPSTLIRLTDARGYDAEASVSPDGEWVVFSSNRRAFDHPLSDDDSRQLEIDPAYFADIYIMRTDGSGQTRLTDVPGYDGGPFFFPDGSRIIWRRFTEDGLRADVWTMNPDGSDQRRVTDFGALSWAPYLHPSGEYLFFASNKLGFTNFEIYIVDVEGTKEPVQVTTTDGFDGLPVPSPDGTELSWTSSRHGDRGRGSGQIFVADWNHEKALELLAASPARVAVGGQQADSTSRAHVEYLASDELGGRLTGSPDAAKAADYIVAQLEAIGARPLPGSDGFRLPFEFTSGIKDVGSSLQTFSSGRQRGVRSGAASIRALSLSDSGEVSGSLVFAGYGITVPDSDEYTYDNFATLDVEGKIVVVLRYRPDDVDQETRALLGRYSSLRYKAMRARELGAVGLLVVTGPRSPNAGELIDMVFDTAAAGSGIVAASIGGELADALFETVPDKTLEAVQEALDAGDPQVVGFEFPDLEANLSVMVERERSTGYNVAGYLPPSDAGAPVQDKPYVMLGAHYDHLGRGRGGNSLARGAEVGDIHNGADDNASGVAAVLAAGAQLAGMSRDRGIVLAFWSGEEFGLLGANAFAESGVVDATELAAYLNFDMVGRVRDNVLTLQAVGSSDIWPRLIERTNVPLGFDIRTQDDPWVPTDSSAFNRVGVPTLSFFSGTHEEYHSPRDDADLINYEDLDRVARFGALLARRVANEGEPPLFVDVPQSGRQRSSRDTVTVFTGTIPDYAAEVEGLLLGGVIEGGPAALAGLRQGDLIVEFAGQTITNIYDYMYVLDALKIDVAVTITYVRDGERVDTELIPRGRQ